MEAADGEKLAAANWHRRLLRGHAVSDHSGLPLGERDRAFPFQLQRSDFFRNPGLVAFGQCSRRNGDNRNAIDLRGRHLRIEAGHSEGHGHVFGNGHWKLHWRIAKRNAALPFGAPFPNRKPLELPRQACRGKRCRRHCFELEFRVWNSPKRQDHLPLSIVYARSIERWNKETTLRVMAL